jgi:type I restriction enzyme M protein
LSKHRDEKNPDRENGKPYEFQRREGESAAELAVRIHRLYDAEKAREPDVFTDRISIDPPILALCVEHLEGISLERTELDTKGVAFEEFMGGFFKGDFGQYFTPRELIAFAVEVLDPERKFLVLDPACGSGGFLLYALDHIRREADRRFPKHSTDARQSLEHFAYWHDFAEKKLFGIEVNEELARVAKMNMIIHDDGHTNIVGHDALDFLSKLHDKNPGLAEGKFDLILTNPPFGSVIKRTEKSEGYLEQYDLRNYLGKSTTVAEPDESDQADRDAKRGAKAIKARASIKTEILFLERVHSFLKPGTGRAGIVLPDGILTNSSLQGVRDWLLKSSQQHGVIFVFDWDTENFLTEYFVLLRYTNNLQHRRRIDTRALIKTDVLRKGHVKKLVLRDGLHLPGSRLILAVERFNYFIPQQVIRIAGLIGVEIDQREHAAQFHLQGINLGRPLR